ncbi:hypothetical protein Dimus_002018 [Dionaea muscipula]
MKKPSSAGKPPREPKLEEASPLGHRDGNCDADPADAAFNASTDICQQLLDRYSNSSAAQHRHLCATAAAMRSILLEDSLPLTPFSYFAASMDAVSVSSSDADSVAALAAFLSIVLPLVPDGAIAPEKAVQAAEILVRVIEGRSEVVSNSSVRCLVKCLGVLVGFCDLQDWDSVKLGVETLLKFSMDKRPKVRKCALVCLEKAFNSFGCPLVKKKASKMVFSLFRSYMAFAVKVRAHVSMDERLPKSELSDVVYGLNVVKLIVQHLSSEISKKVVFELLKLFDVRFSVLTRPILDVIQSFLQNFEVEVTSQVAENVILILSPYASLKENPADTVISTAYLLKDALQLRETSNWTEQLRQAVISPIAGLLTFEDDTASRASNILKDLINNLTGRFSSSSSSVSDEITRNVQSNVVSSMFSAFEVLLDSCAAIPNEHVLDVLSALFLNLGDASFPHAKNIILKLAKFMVHAERETQDTVYLEKCFGCAVLALGPAKVLSILPISVDEENFTCLNVWLLPILKKYIMGASLGYFMDHIVPLSESFEMVSHKVKKSVIAQDMQAYARGLWGLLPAFCRHTSDIGPTFDALAKLLVVKVGKDSSAREDIAVALQGLVKQNKCVLQSNDSTGELAKHIDNLLLDESVLVKRIVPPHSKKVAKRNLKAISSCSKELLTVLAKKFLSSTPEKRAYLKEAIQCLASVSDSSVTKKIMASSLKRLKLADALSESGISNLSNASPKVAAETTNSTDNDNVLSWCLMLELASLVVEGADEDLVSLIFELAKHVLQVGDSGSFWQAYFTLSQILEEHSWFCSSQYDNLVDLLVALEAPVDVTSLQNRLCCLKILLVHALKNISDVENTKAFAIINEVVLALKNPKEDFRKGAYDVLLQISSSLHDPSSAKPGEPYCRLINMMLGYLSSASPHMMSGAVSALSLLVYKQPDLCSSVPEMVPSVITLLESKAVEVIKAVLGFVKVLVSSLQVANLQHWLPTIVDGVIRWSSVSRHHFRSKVTVILEFLIRKCGFPAVEMVTAEKYKRFLKNVTLNHRGKTNPKEAGTVAGEAEPGDSSNGCKKRRNEDMREGSGSLLHSGKRRKQQEDMNLGRKEESLTSRLAGGNGNDANRFKDRKLQRYLPGKSNKRKRRDSEQPAPSSYGNKSGKKKGIHRGRGGGGGAQRTATMKSAGR